MKDATMNGWTAVLLVIMALEVVRRADDERRGSNASTSTASGEPLIPPLANGRVGVAVASRTAVALPDCALHTRAAS